MQTCTICHSLSVDTATHCSNCQVKLDEYSEQAVALKKYRDNPRVQSIRVEVSADCCPACRKKEGTYSKTDVPVLPVKGCSHENGCRCFYEPILTEIFP
ncbi:MAG: hypothetical protein GYA12_11365 [Chloroflexi bacterium]|nr:hypothetical protein [Chloroflexota bacterium]